MAFVTWLIISLTLMYQLKQVTPYPEADLIKNLPGQPAVKFQQFSGYITVGETHQRNLFYYFVEAEINPHSKPLVLWLNGGPGCSSVGYGAFSEQGPFRPTGNALLRNDYSWNKEANMLYLESPAGVGFSYSSNNTFYSIVNDELTANDNLEFLQKWLAKFSEYNNQDLFITGESYGGHYVPQLANVILKSTLKSNLKGIAIGNPLLEFNTDFNSRGEYLWSHGLISDSTYGLMQTKCNYSQIRRQATQGSLSLDCAAVNSQMSSEIGNAVDAYDVILDVCLHQQQARLLQQMEGVKIDVCQDDQTTNYMNNKQVQRALHAQLVGINQWSLCSSVVHYHMDDLEVPSLPILGTLTKAGVRVLVFSGDQDSVLPFTGTRELVNRLAKDLGLKTTAPYRPWFSGDHQVGGWAQVYGDILTFATIRGAAHEAPFTQPARSLALFSSFILGKPPIELVHK